MRGRWRPILRTVAAAYGVLVAAALGLALSGVYDIGASEPHWNITRSLMETARTQSIRMHAAGTKVPSGLLDPATIAMGVEHFAMHCAVCHGAPGVPRSDIAQGMYPQPPDLALAAKRYSDAELFWIIQHGIKMTGMPAWADHSDAEIGATVAFLKLLAAGMTEQQYGELVKANMMRGMKHQPGGGAAPDPAPAHAHAH
jgi:mono/diheme cytochrome c family protein